MSTASPKTKQEETYLALKSQLQSLHAPNSSPLTLLPTPSSLSPRSSHPITLLSLNPVLESLLHILTNDLPSAHFLLRHMQSPPAYEAMFVHALLHRVEGDFENARCWYGDLSSAGAEAEVFGAVWPEGLEGERGVGAFLDALKGGEREGWVRERGEREWRSVFEFCERKFGTGRVEDAREVWVEPSEKIREAAKNQVVGGEGWRKF